jgi:hypothetical protein
MLYFVSEFHENTTSDIPQALRPVDVFKDSAELSEKHQAQVDDNIQIKGTFRKTHALDDPIQD